MRFVLAFGALLLLSGCGSLLGGSSPKTHFYTLSEVTAGKPVRSAPQHPVQLSAVHLPATLDRQSMILNTSGNAVTVDSSDVWTAPLDQMTRNVLSEDLAALLPASSLILPDTPAPSDANQIVVTLTQFGPQSDGSVMLTGEWARVDAGSGKPSLRHSVHLSERPSGTGAAPVAAAMSSLLGKLASRMATDLTGS